MIAVCVSAVIDSLLICSFASFVRQNWWKVQSEKEIRQLHPFKCVYTRARFLAYTSSHWKCSYWNRHTHQFLFWLHIFFFLLRFESFVVFFASISLPFLLDFIYAFLLAWPHAGNVILPACSTNDIINRRRWNNNNNKKLYMNCRWVYIGKKIHLAICVRSSEKKNR